jgi:uncharacterized protein (DUF2062 family)
LSNPHRLPPPFKARTLDFHEWWSWTTFLKVGEPVLLGSLVIAVPAALGCYFVVHYATVRYRKHQAQKAAAQA